MNNKIVGRTTSGNYSFNFNKNLAYGYVEQNIKNDKEIYIEVEKKKYKANILSAPLNKKNIKTI